MMNDNFPYEPGEEPSTDRILTKEEIKLLENDN